MKTVVFSLLLISLAAVHADGEPKPASKPNIIFFLVDDMGWQETSVPFHTETTVLNRRYRTPNMERLAAEGMKFTQAYASALCSPTRVSALTGMNAARHRVTNWTLRKDRSPDNSSKVIQPPEWNLNGICTNAGIRRTMQVTPLPALLRTSGYRTIHVGKAHFGAKDTPGENPLNLGFDVNIAGHAAGGPGSYWGEKNFSAAWRTKPPDLIWDVPGLEAYHGTNIYLTEALTLEAIKAVEKSVADQQPFYLYLAHYAVHAPWEKDDRFNRKYLDAGLKPSEATLASMIEGMDKSLGDLMATLARLGVADNTIIIFMSDNGSPSQCPPNLPLRGHKLTPYEGGIREPMIVKWPGVTRPATVCHDPVLIEDFFPTILELAGAEWRGKTIQSVDGVSFASLLKTGSATSTNRPLVWHFPNNYGGQTPFSAIRVGSFKLIYHHADRRMELFDLDTDISEKTNLAGREPQKVRELAATLAALLKERGAQMPTDRNSGQPVPWPDALQTPPSAKPNIVIMLTDDQGYADVGVFGAKGFQTPNLDRMAAEGAIFRNFHVAQPVCSASRCALLTGCYPNRLGIHGALSPRSPVGLSASEMTLAELVKQRGYATAMFGKWHLGDAPQFLPPRHGFDEYFGLPYSNDMWPLHPDVVKLSPESVARKRGYPDLPMIEGGKVVIPKVTHEDQNQLTTWYTEHAVKFIERNRDHPFLLYVAHNMPHVPLHVSDKFRGKSAQGLYGDVIAEIDWSVGQILDALKRCGLEQNTWVIFTSDNGPWLSYGNHAGSALPLREGKGTSWEGGTRVPCIMRWPGQIPAGTDTADMLMTIDLFPTIAGRIGAELPRHKIDGLDVWPVISRQPGATNPHASYWFYYDSNQLQAVTSGDGRWKLQLPHTYRTMAGQPAGRDGTPGPYRSGQIEQAELYDLANDLGEGRDVSGQHPDRLKQLEACAEQARAELGDTLAKRTGRGVREPGRVSPAKTESK